MKERIIWIDWAKALAVCCVVFCHLPQSQDWFYYRYLQADIITIFFFISGYLKKDHGSDKANWQKYWHSHPTSSIMPSSILIGWLSSTCSMVVCQISSKPCALSWALYSSNMRMPSANRLTVRFGIYLLSSSCTSLSICAERPNTSMPL